MVVVDAGRRLSLGSPLTWASLCLGITALGVLELAVGALVVRALLEPPWSALIESLLLLLTLAVLLVVWSPMRARLRLDADRLVVDFRLLGRLSIDLATVVEVAEHHPDPMHPVPLGIDAATGPGPVSLSRGAGDGFVLIRADTPQPVRHMVVKRTLTDAAVIRVADPHAVVAEVRAAVDRRGRRR